MMALLIYIGKTAVAQAVFYLFYRLLLRKETFHRLSRAVLVGTCLVSFLLPLCIVTIHKPVQGNAALQAMMDTFSTQLQVASAGTPWWQTALVLLYWTGCGGSFWLVEVRFGLWRPALAAPGGR